MFEEQTYPTILQRMLDQAPPDIDKREGSIIYDTLAPAAAELAQAYIQLDAVLDLGFAKTSNGEYLDLRTQEHGVYRQQATKTVRQATFNMAPGLGARFFVDDLYFTVIQDGTTAQVECATAGTVGNAPLSGINLLPVETIAGLTNAHLGEVLIPGTDSETDEQLLARYLQEVTERATAGNHYHYIKWAQEVPGVGNVLVEPLWQGEGTVRVIILDPQGRPASPFTIDQVQEYLDPGSKGIGQGMAPVGARVTVTTANERPINITIPSLAAEPGYAPDQAETNAEAALADYLTKINPGCVIRIREIEGAVINTTGILDMGELLLDGARENIILEVTEVAALGSVTYS